MYLKSIEVHGFKSFANKISFDFHEGITGIVGPNGSGKSNVADAVRWVFGEQKVKQLRGGSMQDVIFSGTEMRKPLSYASVAITLDNADHQLPIEYEEVKISRKLYRSGESEYAINGTHCRLKDINELFYDTGIGKEGYSIIGQGQIDKILSGKPEERRELFDEAAGIVKYKKRKNMSVKKLEAEQQNLVRVKDILSEIEKQIGPLEKQSIVAKEYLQKKEELKVYDINMFLLDTARLKEQLAEMERNIHITATQYEQISTQYEAMKEAYEQAEEEGVLVQEQIEQLQSTVNETNMLKQQLEGRIAVLQEQINTIRMNDEHIGTRMQTILEEIANRQATARVFDAQYQEYKENWEVEQNNAAQVEQRLREIQSEIAEYVTSVDQNKEKIMNILNERTNTKSKMQRLDTMLEQGQIRKSHLTRQLVEVQTERAGCQVQLQEFQQQKNKVQEEVQDIQERIASYEHTIQEIQQALQLENQELRSMQTNYHREASRLETLHNMTERYDGYGNSIRKVMDQKSRVAGLLGVVADLIQAEKKYEVAIETALGGNIQNIVTDSDVTAKKMVAYLKQNKFGRATFLPLTSIKGGQSIRFPEALQEAGVIGVASNLVQVQEQYRNLAENLLGRTIVVTSIDIGLALGRKYQHSLRIVTLDGELLNPGGSITGGAFRNTSNLLGRRREMEELQKQVKELGQAITQLETAIEQKKTERQTCYGQVDQLKAVYQTTTIALNTSEMQVQQMTNRLNDIESKFLEIQNESGEIALKRDSITGHVDTVKLELEQSEELEQESIQAIEHLQAILSTAKEQEVVIAEENEQSRLNLMATKQKFEFLQENNQRVVTEIEKLVEEQQRLESNKGDASAEIQNKQEEIAGYEEAILNAADVQKELAEQITEAVAQKEALNQKHKHLLTEREHVAQEIASLDKEKFRLESKKEELELQSEKNMNYMWDEYELTYNYALQMRDPNLIDIQVMRTNIRDLKTQIKNLGSVNVNAIEDFKELSERHTFLRTQHDDLIEAEKTLLEIIEELDSAMRLQFQEQFALISAEYDKVFKQLFGGGKGTLELLEDEDILEAGIRIIAQPPGKKLQNMMQLSGGEKALTAISLLFAIQNLKPSPFCLLDEIEAALDDSNVGRYAQYLHKLTKHTQFIVITHRRGTMTAADRLYGITMQEKGISTLVSVDLLQDELEE